MTVSIDTIKARHSVRAYTDAPLTTEQVATLEAEIAACNKEGNLSFKLMVNEPEAFNSAMAHYGKFSGVRNYIILAGPKADDLEERCGYYGERLALLAQDLGLNTCWVAMTFKKRFVKTEVAPGSDLVVVLALGYGQTQGATHKNKELSKVSYIEQGTAPEWFNKGLEAALLAPTAMNQQSFMITYPDTHKDGKPVVEIEARGGFYCNVDLGIVKQHFEIGAGKDTFVWA